MPACLQPSKKGTTSGKSKLRNTTTQYNIDTNLLAAPGAVVVNPSFRMIDKMKKENKADDYNTVVDDNVWYMSQSEQYLDSVKAKKIPRESEGVIKFRTESGKIYTMKLNTLFFGIILFNGKDKPMIADMTDIGDDYQKYMKK